MPCYDHRDAEDRAFNELRANLLCRLVNHLKREGVKLPQPFEEYDRLHSARDAAYKRFSKLQKTHAEPIWRQALHEADIEEAKERTFLKKLYKEVYGRELS